MKNILFAVAVALFSSAAYAHQEATVTRTEVGEIVSIGQPIYDNIQTQTSCRQSYAPTQRQHRNLNSGTVLGGLVGGLAGSQVGGGRGRDAAIAVGAVTGAMIGNDINREAYHDRRYENRGNTCYRQENRIVGWTYTINVNGVLIDGTTYSHRRPYIGQRIYMTVTSTYRPQN